MNGCKILKVSKGAKVRNRYNKVPHLTQDTNGKVKTHLRLALKMLIFKYESALQSIQPGLCLFGLDL